MAGTDDFFDLVLFGELEQLRQCLSVDPALAQAVDGYGFTALHVLMTEERPDVADLLIKLGADVRARNDDGMTPLHLAQYPALVDVLIKHGSDLNARSNDGSTALHVSAAEGEDAGSVEVIEALLSAGADAGLRNDDGNTPEQIALEREEDDKVALFKRFQKQH